MASDLTPEREQEIRDRYFPGRSGKPVLSSLSVSSASPWQMEQERTHFMGREDEAAYEPERQSIRERNQAITDEMGAQRDGMIAARLVESATLGELARDRSLIEELGSRRELADTVIAHIQTMAPGEQEACSELRDVCLYARRHEPYSDARLRQESRETYGLDLGGSSFDL